ncbi:MAG: DUF2069 domain-containing protein [Burkholderiales bacterium]|nr:DUF2069 domain-containing protein [Burkholderiales bacterium]
MSAAPSSDSADRWRAIALGCTLGLVVLGLGWELWWAPLPGGTGMLAVKVIPLAFALPGLARHRLYTYRWVSLLVWLYVTEALVRVAEPPPVRLLAGAELALALLLFAACGIYVRARLAAGRRLAAQAGAGDA